MLREGRITMKESYEPTPEQIRAECQKIQAEWSESERLRRAGISLEGAMDRRRWHPPLVNEGEIANAHKN